MRISHYLRRSAALILPALLGLGAVSPHAGAATTQTANLVLISLADLEEAPYGIRGDLMLANDGNIYLASSSGGNGAGSIARVEPDGTVTVLHAFEDASEGAFSYAKLIQASDDALYGTAFLGGENGGGVIFRITLAGEYSILRSFGTSSTDAGLPYTGVVQAADGYLYGTTLRGGQNDKGTVYRINLAGTDFSILHSFDGSDGENPEGQLVIGNDGMLYGTTLQGGSSNRGVIYRITTSGTLETLYSFPGLRAFTDGLATNDTGANPRAGLLLAADGNFYGTAYQGGDTGYGTFFRMAPDGTVTVVHHFTGPSFGGGFPLAGVVQDSLGNFYGTSSRGGYLDRGSAWRIGPAGDFTLLHGFSGSNLDGGDLYSGLLLVNDRIYGATFSDQLLGRGNLFRLELGTGGVLPVQISVSETEIVRGSSVQLTWTAATATECTKAGIWTGTAAASGTETITPASAGIYTYGLRCEDSNGVSHYGWVALVVNAPPLDSVDGGGGAGAASWLLLLLLAALLTRKLIKETASTCP